MASRFPAYPISWYLFGHSADVPRNKPVGREMLGRKLVAFRTSGGRPVILDGRCSHLGADLSLGRVIQDSVQCSFHHWEYGADGHCTHIPVTNKIPACARQACYPVIERNGLLFFFNAAEPAFPLPFFPGCQPDDFVAARSFSTVLDCEWYMVGANAFDLQHFRAAHDRRLVGRPTVDCPAPFARRAAAAFEVASDSLQDRLTRLFAGDQVTMSITDWCGNLMFATARFRRTCSYGMVITEPLASGQVCVKVIVFVPRSSTFLGRTCIDPYHAWVRRLFIKKFLSADAARLQGARYNPSGLIPEDAELAQYFDWLAGVACGVPHLEETTPPSSAENSVPAAALLEETQ